MASGRERFQVLTAVDLRHKMDALVSDLSHALDESQSPQYHRKRRGFKRRTKCLNAIGHSINRLASEDSSSSLGEVLLSQDNKSSMPLTDSDDMSPAPEPRQRTHLLTHHRATVTLAESDSVNENFSPARMNNRSFGVADLMKRPCYGCAVSCDTASDPGQWTKCRDDPSSRRKRKCKRMALDPDAPSSSTTPSAGQSASVPSLLVNMKKKKVFRPSPDGENRYLTISVGKRKRGRERSVEWGHQGEECEIGSCRNFHHHNHITIEHSSTSSSKVNEDEMEYQESDEADMDGSSCESSSDSEAGIFTCDEGREADDEQSDWFAEPGPVYGVPGVPSTSSLLCQRNQSNCLTSWWGDSEIGISSSSAKVAALFKERYETLSQENQQAYRLRFQKLRERLLRREIRAGRRRLRDRRPGFSIISSVNDKVSRFLQDPGQSELRLKPMNDRDRDQLNHLASLYSLNVHSEDTHSAPILTKTRNTITTQQLEQGSPGHSMATNLGKVRSNDGILMNSYSTPLGAASSTKSGGLRGHFPGGLPVPVSDIKRRRRTPPPPQNLTEGSNDSVESVIHNSYMCVGLSSRPPVPMASWDDDIADVGADSLSERLADSEPDPLPSPTSLGLHDCTL